MAGLVWDQRELPILRAVVETLDDGGSWVKAATIVAKTGLPEKQVQAGLAALVDDFPPYITTIDVSGAAGREILGVSAVSGAARRAVGTWPTPEGRAAELVAAIQQVAEQESDEETKGRLRKVAAYLGSAGRDLLVEVLAAAITRRTDLG